MKNFGKFQGELDLRVLPPPAKRAWWEFLFPRRPEVMVLKNFTYIDKDDKHWEARPGTKINGLSSPRFFWRLMPPFEWRGIKAAAIHDAGCTYCIEPSQKVHQAMYRVMRRDNMSPFRAFIAWFLVRSFGPRFDGMTPEQLEKWLAMTPEQLEKWLADHENPKPRRRNRQ